MAQVKNKQMKERNISRGNTKNLPIDSMSVIVDRVGAYLPAKLVGREGQDT